MIALCVLAMVAGCQSAQYIEERGKRAEMTASADYQTVYHLLQDRAMAHWQQMGGIAALTAHLSVQGRMDPIAKVARIEHSMDSAGIRSVASVIRIEQTPAGVCVVTVFSDPRYPENYAGLCVEKWLREANLLIEPPAQLPAGR